MQVFVVTSDGYVDELIHGFMGCWNRNCGVPVTVLGYREPVERLPDNAKFYSMGEQIGKDWCSKLRVAIEKMGESRFLVMLDDYYLNAKVEEGILDRLPECDKFDVSGDRVKFKYEFVEDHVRMGLFEYGLPIRSSQLARYRPSLQAAVWKKEYFLKFCCPGWTIWEYELLGSEMAYNDGALILGTTIPILRYDNIMKKGKRVSSPLAIPPSGH